MAIEVFNRFEHKYMLNKEEYGEMLETLEQYMEADKHSQNRTPYTIANIYYDTADNYLIRNSLSKPKYKEKLRLRAYGVPGENSEVFLEIKKKFNGIVNKRRTVLKLPEAYEFTETGVAPKAKDYMNKQVLREIEYFLRVYSVQPKLYLAYDRIAYFEKDNQDLRISFDMNIRSRREDLRLESGTHGMPLLDKDVYLMEIKTSLAKPLWLTHKLNELGLRRSSFSKYGTEFRRTVKTYEAAYGLFETAQKPLQTPHEPLQIPYEPVQTAWQRLAGAALAERELSKL